MHLLSVLCLASTVDVNENRKSVASDLMNHCSQGSIVHVRIRQKTRGNAQFSLLWSTTQEYYSIFACNGPLLEDILPRLYLHYTRVAFAPCNEKVISERFPQRLLVKYS